MARDSSQARSTAALVVISGPSGVGKTVLCSKLVERYRCNRAITATSRAPRPGEKAGEDYYFCDRETFLKDAREGRFLEHAEVHGHLYGIPREPLDERLGRGEVVLLTIDVQGAEELMRQQKPATYVFIEPPDMAELERRLLARGSEDPESAAMRLENARREMGRKDRYDLCVVNGNMETAVEELGVLLGLEKRESK